MNNKSDCLGSASAEASGATDARKLALDCMLTALEHLDSDAGISPFVGVQLQLAIDRLAFSIPAAAPRDQLP